LEREQLPHKLLIQSRQKPLIAKKRYQKKTDVPK
jgi:hypothetical protein